MSYEGNFVSTMQAPYLLSPATISKKIAEVEEILNTETELYLAEVVQATKVEKLREIAEMETNVTWVLLWT